MDEPSAGRRSLRRDVVTVRQQLLRLPENSEGTTTPGVGNTPRKREAGALRLLRRNRAFRSAAKRSLRHHCESCLPFSTGYRVLARLGGSENHRVPASIGGLLSIMYAADYPADVVGIVLLDSTLPTLDVILRLMPEPERAAELALLANNGDLNVLDTLAEARRLLPAVPDIPILMLVSRPRPDLPPAWPEAAMHAAMDAAEQEFLGALRQGEQREVRSGHVIQQDAPQVVVDELRGFLDRHPHRMVTRTR
jgi:pimeloyl-ACP methyl ester carboxylesterase